jgi:hypothetical protein
MWGGLSQFTRGFRTNHSRGTSMSRTLAAVIGITLGLPLLAMIAISVSSGLNPDFLLTFVIGAVVTTFVVCAVFEIKRMADLDSDHGPDRHEALSGETLAPEVHDATPPPLAVASAAEHATAVLVPEVSLNRIEQARAETIVVEPMAERAAATKAQTGGKSAQRKRPTVPTASVAAKSKRKPTQRKDVTPA